MRRGESRVWRGAVLKEGIRLEIVDFKTLKSKKNFSSLDDHFKLADENTLAEVNPITRGQQGCIFLGEIQDGKNNKKTCVVKQIKKQKIPLHSLPENQKKNIKEMVQDHLADGFNTHQYVTNDFNLTCADRGVIQLLCQFEDKKHFYAVFPYCDEFLSGYLKKNKPDEKDQLKILSDLVSALSYLHEEKKVLHNDIKPENIGFYQGKWCLFDLDCASVIGEKKPGSDGALQYRCPRSFIFPEYGAQMSNDIYALGCVMKEVLTGLFSSTETPSEFEKRIRNEYYQLKKVKQNTIQNDALSTMQAWIKKDKGAKASEMLNTLVDAMTNPNPFRRPRLHEIKQFLFLIKAKEPRVSTFDSIAAFFKINKPSEQPAFAGIPYATENRFFGASVFSQASSQSNDNRPAKKASS